MDKEGAHMCLCHHLDRKSVLCTGALHLSGAHVWRDLSFPQHDVACETLLVFPAYFLAFLCPSPRSDMTVHLTPPLGSPMFPPLALWISHSRTYSFLASVCIFAVALVPVQCPAHRGGFRPYVPYQNHPGFFSFWLYSKSPKSRTRDSDLCIWEQEASEDGVVGLGSQALQWAVQPGASVLRMEARTLMPWLSAQTAQLSHHSTLSCGLTQLWRAAEKHRVFEVGPAVSTGTVHTAAATSRSGARHMTKNICYQDATSFNPHCSFNLPILWKEIYHPVKESHRVWSHSVCYLFEFILLSVLGSNRGLDMLSKCCISEQHA